MKIPQSWPIATNKAKKALGLSWQRMFEHCVTWKSQFPQKLNKRYAIRHRAIIWNLMVIRTGDCQGKTSFTSFVETGNQMGWGISPSLPSRIPVILSTIDPSTSSYHSATNVRNNAMILQVHVGTHRSARKVKRSMESAYTWGPQTSRTAFPYNSFVPNPR